DVRHVDGYPQPRRAVRHVVSLSVQHDRRRAHRDAEQYEQPDDEQVRIEESRTRAVCHSSTVAIRRGLSDVPEVMVRGRDRWHARRRQVLRSVDGMTNSAVAVTGLTRQYKRKTALGGVDLDIGVGETVGILG